MPDPQEPSYWIAVFAVVIAIVGPLCVAALLQYVA